MSTADNMERGSATSPSTKKPWWLQGVEKARATGVSRGPIGEYSGEANRFANMYETSLKKKADADANKVLAELIYGAKPKTSGGGSGYKNIIDSLTGRIGTSNASYDALTAKFVLILLVWMLLTIWERWILWLALLVEIRR